MSHEQRIPKDPKKNLERMQSILAGYKRKLAHKKKIRESTQSKLDRLHEQQAEGPVDEQTAENQAVIERKHKFDLRNLDEAISQLEGQIIWAEKRQIPFIESEIARLDAEADDDVAEPEVVAEGEGQ